MSRGEIWNHKMTTFLGISYWETSLGEISCCKIATLLGESSLTGITGGGNMHHEMAISLADIARVDVIPRFKCHRGRCCWGEMPLFLSVGSAKSEGCHGYQGSVSN